MAWIAAANISAYLVGKVIDGYYGSKKAENDCGQASEPNKEESSIEVAPKSEAELKLENLKNLRNMHATELAEMNKDHVRVVDGLNSRISSVSTALEDLNRKHGKEKEEKEREIEQQRILNAKKIQELEDAFLEKEKEVKYETAEQIQNIKMSNRREIEELMESQNEVLADKTRQLAETKKTHQAEMQKMEQDQKDIMDEKMEELEKHNSKVAQLNAERNEEITEKRNELKQMKTEIVDQNIRQLKERTRIKLEMCRNVMRAQISAMNGRFEADLADRLSEMVLQLTAAIEECKQLEQSVGEIEDNSIVEWWVIEGIARSWMIERSLTLKKNEELQKSINGFTTIDKSFRDGVHQISCSIGRINLDSQSLKISLNSAISQKNLKNLQSLVPKIKEHIESCSVQALEANKIIAPAGRIGELAEEQKSIASEKNRSAIEE